MLKPPRSLEALIVFMSWSHGRLKMEVAIEKPEPAWPELDDHHPLGVEAEDQLFPRAGREWDHLPLPRSDLVRGVSYGSL